MKMVLYPEVEAARLDPIREAAGDMAVVSTASVEEAVSAVEDADAFFGKMTPEILAAANQLRWVQSPTASLEHYLFPELVEHPCQLSNMRGLFSDVIADHVMGFVLCFARNLHAYIRQQVAATWAPIGENKDGIPTFATGPSVISSVDAAHIHLSDATLGVVGVGHIGKEICRRATAFGMTVVGVDPACRSVPDAVETIHDVDWLPELLRVSDFVVIAAPHTPETEKLFDRAKFEAMKRSAYLINIGRGVIVDLADLTSALQDGEISGAALDVYEVEPLPSEHPLWGMDNVILTPHVAAASPRIAERHLATLLENIQQFVNGHDPVTLVDKRKWY